MQQYVESELVPIDGLRGEQISGFEMNTENSQNYRNLPDDPEKNAEIRRKILNQAKAIAETVYHPVGTCKMGKFRCPNEAEHINIDNDDQSVVDPLLRVHGVASLRVADASIMPQITSGNTNAPSIMIGERCSEIILGRYNDEERCFIT